MPIESTVTVKVDPRKEYQAAGYRIGFTGSVNGTLRAEGDEISQNFGLNIYDQMMNDPEVYKCINLLKILTIGTGLEILPSTSENHPDYDKALLMAEFVEYAIRNLSIPLRDTMEEMLDALIYGHKIAEITYKTDEVPGLEGLFLLPDRIKVKRARTVLFVVDKFLNVLGFAGNSGFYGTPAAPETMPSDSKIIVKKNDVYVNVNGEAMKFIERDKFLVLTIRAKDGDPRGKSLLRPAFNAWHLKNQIYPEYLRYLLMCSIPLLVGYTPENEAPTTLIDPATGSPMVNANGVPIHVNPTEALRDALLQARDSTILALKGGSQVQEIGANGSGTPFYKAMEVFDQQIEMAILLQTLAVSEGRYQSRAASQTHMSVLDSLVFTLKGILIDAIINDVVKKLIKYNFGDEWLIYTPTLSLGDTERREFGVDAAAIATLYTAGYLSEDQKKYTDAMLQLPIRDDNYNQYREISPNEALQLNKAVMDQEKIQSDITKAKQEANLSRLQVLAQLKNLLSTTTTSVDAQGRQVAIITTPDIYKDKMEQVNQLVEGMLNEIITDTTNDADENSILEKLTTTGKNMEQLFGPKDSANRGNSNPDLGITSPQSDSSRTLIAGTRIDSAGQNPILPSSGGLIKKGTSRGSYIKPSKSVKLSVGNRFLKGLVSFGVNKK